MSFEVPPVTGVEPTLRTSATQRTDKPLAATTREDDAAEADDPPPPLLPPLLPPQAVSPAATAITHPDASH